jgi:hypothetical protein
MKRGVVPRFSCAAWTDQEGMTQINGAGFTGRQRLRPVSPHPVQHQMGYADLAGRREKPRHIQVRACAYSGRRVLIGYVGEKE